MFVWIAQVFASKGGENVTDFLFGGLLLSKSSSVLAEFR